MFFRRNQTSSHLEDQHWVEVGKKGMNPILTVQIRFLPSNPQLFLFRIIDRKSGRVVVEPWILHQELIEILYNGLLILQKNKGRPNAWRRWNKNEGNVQPLIRDAEGLSSLLSKCSRR